MTEARFGESGPWSLGVEEEVLILDSETLQPAPAVETLLADAQGLDLPGSLSTELHASVIELRTGICATAGAALAASSTLRREADRLAARRGLRLAAAGSHPLARSEQLATVDLPRYRTLVEYAGVSARRQGVNGLHIHVGMPSSEACMRALEGLLPWLPLVLALSANSPYLAGVETGLLSNRAEVLAQLPRSGAPPVFGSYAGWAAFVERFRASGVELGGDYTSFWWDVRPHPRFGTLEVRMPDQPTSVALSGALVALVQALAATVQRPGRWTVADRGVYQQNRWAAARFGTAARLIHPTRNATVSVQELTDELLALVEPAVRELGTSALLAALHPERCEAELQLELGRSRGLEALCADLVERSTMIPDGPAVGNPGG